jgi:hypothetical protein
MFALFGIILLCSLLQYRRPRDHRRRMFYYRSRMAMLDHSGLAERLLSGALTGSEITPYTFVLLRFMVPALKHPAPRQVLERLSSSLDWYLGPPRQHWRQTWIMMLMFCFIALMQTGSATLQLSVSSGFNPALLIPLLTPCFMIFAAAMSSIAMGANGAAMLEQYLAEQWSGAARPVEEQGAPNPATQQMLLLANQVQIDLEKAAASYLVIPIYAIMPVFMLFIPLLAFNGVTQPGGGANLALLAFATSAGAMLLAAAACVLVLYLRLKVHRAAMERRLEGSGLLELLATGELRALDLEEHVPWVFRLLLRFPRMPRGYGDDLRRALWSVALNLDWYTGPRGMLLRPAWIAAAVIILSMAVSFALPFASISYILHNSSQQAAVTPPAWLWSGLLLFALDLAAGVVAADHAMKVRVWYDVLIVSLRRRLAD